MRKSIEQELNELRTMTPPELRGKHLEVFGEPIQSGNKDFLRKRIAWRIQSLAEGTLSERARQRAEELARDADIRTSRPRAPRESKGGTQQTKSTTAFKSKPLPMPGTILTRKYRDQSITVTVLPCGFEWDGQVFRSLSAVAKAITGSHWNGHHFFGLKAGGRE